MPRSDSPSASEPDVQNVARAEAEWGDHARFMRRALALAERGSGQVSPNPKVGCVIVQDGVIVGEGWHQRYGEAHAEVNALAMAGARARGATAYVTLEPCNHTGKTGPCAEALIAAGVARVVCAVRDPNPVASGGLDRLRAAGIAVEHGVLADDVSWHIGPFLAAARGSTRPFVTLKLAISLDGAIVGPARRRAWLTGPESQAYVHVLRADADAVAVGIGTALADDPSLTVRHGVTARVAPHRVVFDRQARLPLTSVLAHTARDTPVVVMAGPEAPVERTAALESLGVTVHRAADVQAALETLRRHGVRHLFVEGGAALASALMASSLVDHLIIFQAPVILGAGAIPAFAGMPGREADVAPRLQVLERRTFGEDLMTRYAVRNAV